MSKTENTPLLKTDLRSNGIDKDAGSKTKKTAKSKRTKSTGSDVEAALLGLPKKVSHRERPGLLSRD
jgi:hypothetical protein